MNKSRCKVYGFLYFNSLYLLHNLEIFKMKNLEEKITASINEAKAWRDVFATYWAMPSTLWFGERG